MEGPSSGAAAMEGLVRSSGGMPAASSTLSMNIASDTAPTNCTRLLITVLGTPEIMYRWAISGYSWASTTSARTWALSIAIAWATRAMGGQYGQVGVTKTWMCTSSLSRFSFFRVSKDSGLTPRDKVTMSSRTLVNSWPAGIP